jgi:hypothetical protein
VRVVDMEEHYEGLSQRQITTLSEIAGAKTFKDGYEKADVPESTFYNWMRKPKYRTALQAEQEIIIRSARHIIVAATVRAAEKLTKHIDSADPITSRLASESILNRAGLSDCGSISQDEDKDERGVWKQFTDKIKGVDY